MDDLCFLTIAEASKLIEARKLSPVELTAAYLARIATFNPQLNAYLLVTGEQAMSTARAHEAEIMQGRYRGPLHGVPVALKDIYSTKGLHTTAHSALLHNHIPDADAFAVTLLHEAGAILLGKTATWEFAIGGTSMDLPWPPARNPWNTKHDPGGSSSGSASAVASGLTMAAMGTDTGGSIRGPAALCGIAGHKPTYGLVSRRGILPLSFSLDHAGPMCWTAQDCALMMGALARHDPRDPGSADVAAPDFASVGGSVRGLRIGYARSYTEQGEASADVVAALEQALDVYRSLGAVITDVELASTVNYADVASTISRSESYAIHEHSLVNTPELYGASFRQRVMPGAFIRACDYVNAMRDRTLLVRQLAEVMNNVDVVVLPTWTQEAHRLDEKMPWSRTKPPFTRPFNVTGAPALSVCSGFNAAGLPLAMQIVGRPFEDHVVLRAGHAFETATQFRKQRPALAA